MKHRLHNTALPCISLQSAAASFSSGVSCNQPSLPLHGCLSFHHLLQGFKVLACLQCHCHQLTLLLCSSSSFVYLSLPFCSNLRLQHSLQGYGVFSSLDSWCQQGWRVQFTHSGCLLGVSPCAHRLSRHSGIVRCAYSFCPCRDFDWPFEVVDCTANLNYALLSSMALIQWPVMQHCIDCSEPAVQHRCVCHHYAG